MTRAEKDRKFRELDRWILRAADYGTLRNYSDLNEEINKAEADGELVKRDLQVLVKGLGFAHGRITSRSIKREG